MSPVAPWRRRFGRRLAESPLSALRRAQGLRAQDVETLAGVSALAVKRLEHQRDVGRVLVGDLVRIAGALGVAPTVLVPGLAVPPQAPELRGAGLRLALRLARELRGPLRAGRGVLGEEPAKADPLRPEVPPE